MSKKRAPHILIIEARYYEHIADMLLEGARVAIKQAGATCDVVTVPGALEIPPALALAAKAGLIPAVKARYQGAVALGCVIRGETTHYETVADLSSQGLMQLAVKRGIPVGNGILTVENEAQALVRARPGEGNKGGDAVRACLRLVELRHDFRHNAAAAAGSDR